MSFLFSPYLSQILTKLLEVLISLQIIKISMYLCNELEVIFIFIWYNKFYSKGPVATGLDQFYLFVDRLGPVFKGPVAVPEYLNRSRLLMVASCLVLEKKTGLTGLENTNCD